MRISLIRAFLTLSLLPVILFSDSWAPPTVRIFSSDDGKYLLYVAPRALKSFPELPEDAEESDKERKALGLNQECWGSLFVKDEERVIGFSNNSFRPVWQKKLVNEIAPMNAYISDDGQFVVTTDDYGRLGDGNNVVVIYGSEGKLIQRYPLTKFIPQSAIDNYEVPQSVSSIYWAGQHQIDNKSGLLRLKVWQSGNPMNQSDKEPVKYRTVTIRLSDGEILNESKSK